MLRHATLLVAIIAIASTNHLQAEAKECGLIPDTGAIVECACGDTVVGDYTLTANIVCPGVCGNCACTSNCSSSAPGIQQEWRCGGPPGPRCYDGITGLTVLGGVVLEGAGKRLVGPPIPGPNGAIPHGNVDRAYGLVFAADTLGATVKNLRVEGFARGVVFQNDLVSCSQDSTCESETGCALGSAGDDCRARVRCDTTLGYCVGNTLLGAESSQPLPTKMGIYGIQIGGDPGGMNTIERCVVEDLGDEGLHVSTSRFNRVLRSAFRDAFREDVYFLEADDNEFSENEVSNTKSGVSQRSLYIKHSDRNRFHGNILRDQPVFFVGTSSENDFGELGRPNSLIKSRIMFDTSDGSSPDETALYYISVDRGNTTGPCVRLGSSTNTLIQGPRFISCQASNQIDGTSQASGSEATVLPCEEYGATTTGNINLDAPIDCLNTSSKTNVHLYVGMLAEPIVAGQALVVYGSGFSPAGVVGQLFVSDKATGTAQSLGAISPTSATTQTLTVPISTAVNLLSGFATFRVINTDQNYIGSNVSAQHIFGLASVYPTVLGLNGIPLAPNEPGTNLANVETVVEAGARMAVRGTGFSQPVVSFFTGDAATFPPDGNAGPLLPTPDSNPSTGQFDVEIPPPSAYRPSFGSRYECLRRLPGVECGVGCRE